MKDISVGRRNMREWEQGTALSMVPGACDFNCACCIQIKMNFNGDSKNLVLFDISISKELSISWASPISVNSRHRTQSCVNHLPPALFETSPRLPWCYQGPEGLDVKPDWKRLGSPSRAAVSSSLTHLKKSLKEPSMGLLLGKGWKVPHTFLDGS